jgi:hypothetical protein
LGSSDLLRRSDEQAQIETSYRTTDVSHNVILAERHAASTPVRGGRTIGVAVRFGFEDPAGRVGAAEDGLVVESEHESRVQRVRAGGDGSFDLAVDA